MVRCAHRVMFASMLMSVFVTYVDGLRLNVWQAEHSKQTLRSMDHKPYALVLAAEPDFTRALTASIRSVIQNTNASFNVHLLVLDEDKDKFEKFSDVDGVPIRQVYFSRSEVEPYLNKAMERSASPNLKSPYQAARLLMADKIPQADGMVWMDFDVIATTDIFADMPAFLESGKIVGSYVRDEVAFVSPEDIEDMKQTTDLQIQDAPYFNSGFYYLSGNRYRENDADKNIRKLIALNNERKWSKISGVQAPMDLILGGEHFYAFKIPVTPNLGTFEGSHEKPSDKFDLSKRTVYHWNGPWKPWVEDGAHTYLWEPFADKEYKKESLLEKPSSCRGTIAQEQQLKGEILDVICEKLQHDGANFLIFGTGHDSSFWVDSNPGGTTHFLEDHAKWVEHQPKSVQDSTYIVNYTSKMVEAMERINDVQMLKEFYDTQLSRQQKAIQWDQILVDGPEGYVESLHPGRGQSIYAASLLANENTVVFVDDCERPVEDRYINAWLLKEGRSLEKYSNGHGGTTCRISPDESAASLFEGNQVTVSEK